jgi:hypothetical protein
MDSKLVKNLINANYKRSAGDDFADGIGGTVKVYTVETDSSRCKFWNSSNNSSFDLLKACTGIADAILEDDEIDEGTVSIGFNEVMFEIEEK